MLFSLDNGRKASEPHPFGAKIKFSLLSSGRGKANVIFKFGALKKARLLLNKLMLPKAQFGLLSYRGQDKRNFSFRSSRERDVTIEQINVPFGAEDQMGYAFPKG